MSSLLSPADSLPTPATHAAPRVGISLAGIALVAAALMVYVSGSFHVAEILGLKRQLQVVLIGPLALAAVYYVVFQPSRLFEPLLLFVLLKAIVEAGLRHDPLYILDNFATLCALVLIYCSPARTFLRGAHFLVLVAGILAVMALIQWVLLFCLPELGQYGITVSEEGMLENTVQHPIAVLGLFSEQQYTLFGRAVGRLQSFAREPSLNVIYFMLPAVVAFVIDSRLSRALGVGLLAYCVLSLSGSVFLSFGFAGAGLLLTGVVSTRTAMLGGFVFWLGLYLAAIQLFGFDAMLQGFEALSQYGDFLGKSESLTTRGSSAVVNMMSAITSPVGAIERPDLPGPWLINGTLAAGWLGTICLIAFLIALARQADLLSEGSELLSFRRVGAMVFLGVLTTIVVFNDYQMNNYAGLVLIGFIHRSLLIKNINRAGMRVIRGGPDR